MTTPFMKIHNNTIHKTSFFGLKSVTHADRTGNNASSLAADTVSDISLQAYHVR